MITKRTILVGGHVINRTAFRFLLFFVLLIAAAPVFAQDSANYVVNGDFASMSGTLPTNWLVFSLPNDTSIQYRVESGVFEYYRETGSVQGVVFQDLNVVLPQFARLEIQADLGNSSAIRKRVTILIHDEDFSDLQVCTFWLAPNTPLQTRVMRTYTTEAWTSATVSLYASSADSIGYARIDNVSVKQRPTMPLVGTECYEPGASLPSPALSAAELQALIPTLVPTATPGAAPYIPPGAPLEMPLAVTPTPSLPNTGN